MTPQEEVAVDVDALLGEDPVSEAPEPEVDEGVVTTDSKGHTTIQPDDQAQNLIDRLEMWNKGCRDMFLDLRTVDFVATEEEMYLKFKEKEVYDKPIHFKVDVDNPKDAKVVHAHKQFCKMVGVPHAFFVQNRPSMKTNIIKTWQAGLEADESKARCVARIRESDEFTQIRALVPEGYCTLQNHELIKTVTEAIPTVYQLEFSVGDQRDDLICHARYLMGDVFEVCGTDCCLGLAVTCSELGASPLIIDSFLYHLESKTAFMASYGSDPFMKLKYDSIQPSELKEAIETVSKRVLGEVDEFVNRVEILNKPIDPMEQCARIKSWYGVSGKFLKQLYHEASECEGDMESHWDFARHMSLIAKDYDITKRPSIERLAGKFLTLSFGKS